MEVALNTIKNTKYFFIILPLLLFFVVYIGNELTVSNTPFFYLSLDESSRTAAGSRTTFVYKLDLDSFQTVGIPSGSSGFTILGPAHPSKVLTMDTVIDIVLVRYIPSMFYLNAFQPLGSSGGHAGFTAFFIFLLDEILGMDRIADDSRFLTITLKVVA